MSELDVIITAKQAVINNEIVSATIHIKNGRITTIEKGSSSTKTTGIKVISVPGNLVIDDLKI